MGQTVLPGMFSNSDAGEDRKAEERVVAEGIWIVLLLNSVLPRAAERCEEQLKQKVPTRSKLHCY